MRIGIDYTSGVHQTAGIGRYTRGLIQALARLDTDNQYTLLVAGRPPQGCLPPLFSRNFRIRYLPLSHRSVTALWQRLRVPLPAEVFTGPVDVFHSPDFVLPPLLRAKKVLTIHDLSFFRYPEGAEPSLSWYLKGAVPRSVAKADIILAVSECTKRDLMELLSVAPERIEVIYEGVGEEFRPMDNGDYLAGVGEAYHIERPFILTVGTLEPRKNLSTLFRAYARLKAEGLPHCLVVAGGRGWRYRGIFEDVERLNLGEDVLFLGFVAEEHLPGLYNLAELFVFPSIYEGFGLPPLEAMACGTPVVTSDSSSLPEVVGEAGLMVSPFDVEALAEAMHRVLEEPSLREGLRAKGLERAKRFTWKASAGCLLEAYRRVGSQRAGRW